MQSKLSSIMLFYWMFKANCTWPGFVPVGMRGERW